jgi:hypothetical protein
MKGYVVTAVPFMLTAPLPQGLALKVMVMVGEPTDVVTDVPPPPSGQPASTGRAKARVAMAAQASEAVIIHRLLKLAVCLLITLPKLQKPIFFKPSLSSVYRQAPKELIW